MTLNHYVIIAILACPTHNSLILSMNNKNLLSFQFSFKIFQCIGNIELRVLSLLRQQTPKTNTKSKSQIQDHQVNSFKKVFYYLLMFQRRSYFYLVIHLLILPRLTRHILYSRHSWWQKNGKMIKMTPFSTAHNSMNMLICVSMGKGKRKPLVSLSLTISDSTLPLLASDG